MVLELLIRFTQTLISIASFILAIATIYNLVIFIIGCRKKCIAESKSIMLRKISLIIPIKDEINSLPLIFESLKHIIYPKNLLEVIFVVSKNSKQCIEACKEFLKENGEWIKVLIDEGKGKPSALNLGLRHASGDIIGVFDVDSILPKDILLRVSEVFLSEDIIAIQGITKPYNENKNFLSKLASIEEKAYFTLFLEPRSNLSLFLPFTGSCLFIKKKFLLEIGGWSEIALAEDLEIALKLFNNGIKIKLKPEISCQHEVASKLTPYLIQRLRWFRGYLQLLSRALKKITTLNPHWIDISIILASPILLSLSLIIFIYSLISTNANIPINFFKPIAWSLLITATPAFLYLTFKLRRIKLRTILLIPAAIAYWILESFIALIALITSLFRIKIKWVRTPKSGIKELMDNE
jgi:cellulose synthase/poly-beta-1,6-N-acetylglucosamine synthase-like glycosyltransferase